VISCEPLLGVVACQGWLITISQNGRNDGPCLT